MCAKKAPVLCGISRDVTKILKAYPHLCSLPLLLNHCPTSNPAPTHHQIALCLSQVRSSQMHLLYLDWTQGPPNLSILICLPLTCFLPKECSCLSLTTCRWLCHWSHCWILRGLTGCPLICFPANISLNSYKMNNVKLFDWPERFMEKSVVKNPVR